MLGCYKVDPPHGLTHARVLLEAHRIRTERGDPHIADEHLADTLTRLVAATQPSLSEERGPKDPYTAKPPVWD